MRLQRTRTATLLAGICLLVVMTVSRVLSAQEGDPTSRANSLEQQLRTELNRKLNQPIEAKFDAVPLRDAVETIAEDIKADVIFDDRAIAEESLTIDAEVSLSLDQTQPPARDVLELILEPQGLAAVNRNGVLMITIHKVAEECLYIQVYNVRDLIEAWGQHNKTYTIHDIMAHLPGEHPLNDIEFKYTAEMAIIQVLKETTQGPWYDIAGSGGLMYAYEGQLIVRQNYQNHAEIQQILDAWRANIAEDHSDQPLSTNPESTRRSASPEQSDGTTPMDE